ncbi:MAG TPA: class I SAM-dependent methyltransferase [Flavobacteriaceae bacterium]|nr:class I SAM-dependent methyltransferase [Flavobacteriaceae bacterium]
MKLQHGCSLCLSEAEFFWRYDSKDYYECPECQAVFLAAEFHPEQQAELQRYQLHQNDVNDVDYQNFVKPLVQAIQTDFSVNNEGLDFGCGSGPVATKLLRDEEYQVKVYDPYFFNIPENLDFKYDFIICCEVIEHFYQPRIEFELLFDLLNPDGKLYAKTSLIDTKIKMDFNNWGYKNDPTHVFFYTPETLTWIKKQFGFANLKLHKDFFVLEK